MADFLVRRLDDLKRQLLILSGHVEDGAAKVVSALANRDVRLAEEVVRADEEIDRLEVEIETECEKILCLQGPVACDMRFVVASLKISSYLERTGDLTKKIGKTVVYLCGLPPTTVQVDFRDIAERARSMVKRSMDAFITGDVVLARQVIAEDDALDDMKDELYEQVLDAIPRHLDQLKPLLKLYSVARNFERLGDMATHVAEEVVFLVDGDNVRHSLRRNIAG
jgi:phosphate transport system protein